jgi:GTP-binding protein
MGVPQVVIVGRPNVGKSSVFNWLAGRRLSIVEDKPGVTRDRVTYLLHAHDRFFELVDTGGMGIDDADNLTSQIEAQIEMAIDTATVVLFVVDVQAGLTALDEEVARRLRYVDAPVLLVANKCDNAQLEQQASEFYQLGRGKLLSVSTVHNRGRDELLRQIAERLPDYALPAAAAASEPQMKLAIVGRRNVGKSTFVNTLAQAERMIVSEVPGTTRDSVDVHFQMDGKTFIAIDTPGLRRAAAVSGDIEFYSTHRAQRSIRRADVVLLFFDATQNISRVDKQLAGYIAEHFKPCIFVVNKWDLQAGRMPTERWVHYLRDQFRNMWHVPIAFITGQTGKNVKALINHAQMLFKQSRMRIATAELNRLVAAAVERNPPRMHQGHRGKIYYATQVGEQPPTMVLICNHPEVFDAAYRRYLLGVFRDQLPFGEVPIKLYLRKRDSRHRDEGSRDEPGGAVDSASQAAEKASPR